MGAHVLPVAPWRRVPLLSPPNVLPPSTRAQTNDNMLLLKTEMGAGHFSVTGRFERLKEVRGGKNGRRGSTWLMLFAGAEIRLRLRRVRVCVSGGGAVAGHHDGASTPLTLHDGASHQPVPPQGLGWHPGRPAGRARAPALRPALRSVPATRLAG
jgi:hypothetical protein